MNNDQLLSLLRTILKLVGSALVTHGVLSAGLWEPIAGVIIALAPIALDMLTHTQQAMIQKVAAAINDPNSPVQGLILTATPEGKKIADSTPSNAVVVAGTSGAAEVVKP